MKKGEERLGLHQVIHTIISKTHTQEAMEVDVLASAAGNGGVKRKREEEEIGVKDSPSKRTKTVEKPTYLPPVPTTALTPGGIEVQAQPALKR